MSISIKKLLEINRLIDFQRLKWSEKPTTNSEGVYIVSLSDDPHANNNKCIHAPISKDIIEKWINKVNGFEIDKQMTFDSDIVIERLSKFWLPNENILYIGKGPIRSNGKALDNRINEFYKTEYGEKRPHAGGHWIKSLSKLDDLFVYAIPCDEPGAVEIKMLEYFITNVSDIPQNQFLDPNLCLPFANLQLTPSKKKKHGLGKMKKR